MRFRKYMHIERFGESSKVEGIEKGRCFIFPKIDGSNTQAWLEDDEVKVGKRKATSNMEPNIYKKIINDKNIERFLKENSNLRLYGEFLTPHTLRTYDKDAWDKFYIFDVEENINDNYRLMSYEEYSELLDKYSLTYIKPLSILDYPTTEDFSRLLESNKFLITEKQDSIGEGIVIKNYDYISKQTKQQLFAKIIRAEFFAKQHKLKLGEELKTKIEKPVEERIAEEYFTDSFIEKEVDKALKTLFEGEFESKEDRKRIPEIFDFVFYAFVEEDIINVVERYNKPNISFLQLFILCRERIKEVSYIFKNNKTNERN